MRKIYRFLLIALMLTSSMVSAPIVHADECDHDWQESGAGYYEKYSDTQHKIVNFYTCTKCSETKQEEIYRDHKLVKQSPKMISKTQHAYKTSYCSECEEQIASNIKENHKFNKYHICSICGGSVAKNITLAANKTAYVNKKSWIKINIKENGYIQVTTREWDPGYDGADWSLYNSKKQVFYDAKKLGRNRIVPVKKGTYYIRVTNYTTIKYKFKKYKYSPKKNNTYKKSVKLPKNKKAISMHDPLNKQTWERYYKIQITNPQKVRIEFDSSEDGRTFLFIFKDSKGRSVPVDSVLDKDGKLQYVITRKKLKKGTYYIGHKRGYEGCNKNRTLGSVFSVKWY